MNVRQRQVMEFGGIVTGVDGETELSYQFRNTNFWWDSCAGICCGELAGHCLFGSGLFFVHQKFADCTDRKTAACAGDGSKLAAQLLR